MVDGVAGLAAALGGSALGAAAAGSGSDDLVAAAVGAWGFHVGVADGRIHPFGCGGLGCFSLSRGVGNELGNRAVDGLFLHGLDFGHGEFGLSLVRGGHFAVAGDEGASHPTEDVVGQRESVANIRVLGESARLESLVGEFLDQAFQWHTVLQGHRREGSHGVHQAADGATFLGHLDKEFTGLAVIEEADGDVAFVSGDFEFVGDGLAGVRHVLADRLVGFFLKLLVFDGEFGHAVFEFGDQIIFVAAGSDLVSLSAHAFGFLGIEWGGAFGSVTVDGDGFEAEFPSFDVGFHDILDGGFLRKVDRFGDRSREEWLGRGHHADVAEVVETTFALVGLEGAVEDRQVLGLEVTADGLSGLFVDYILDGIVFLDVGEDVGDFRFRVSEILQCRGDGLVDNFQHTSAGQQFVFHQGDVGFDSGGITVHQETDRAGGRKQGDLGVAVAELFAFFEGGIPGFAGGGGDVGKAGFGCQVIQFRPVVFDDLEHGGFIGCFFRVGVGRVGGIEVAGEGRAGGCHICALLIGGTGHEGGDGAGEVACFIGVVGQAVAHDQGTDVGVAESERAEEVGVFRDVFDRVAGSVDNDFLCRDEEFTGGGEAFGIETAVGVLEAHQVE